MSIKRAALSDFGTIEKRMSTRSQLLGQVFAFRVSWFVVAFLRAMRTLLVTVCEKRWNTPWQPITTLVCTSIRGYKVLRLGAYSHNVIYLLNLSQLWPYFMHKLKKSTRDMYSAFSEPEPWPWPLSTVYQIKEKPNLPLELNNIRFISLSAIDKEIRVRIRNLKRGDVGRSVTPEHVCGETKSLD
jgi:hypothetical protein